jgi:ADP-ribose pyrophosphatase
MYSARAFRGKEGAEHRMPFARGSLGFPEIQLEQIEDLSPGSGTGFLTLIRRRLVAHYPDGTVSAPFVYDEVDRRSIDAVVIAAHYVGPGGERRVFLRSALRPPVYFRGTSRAPTAVPDNQGGLWELPAGLVEADEQSPEGLVRGAARELHEELGFAVPESALRPLGPSTYPCPGVIAERHFYFEVTVDPETRVEPPLDGSALEHLGKIVDVTFAEALELCRDGAIEDAKSELLLRRLGERYP